MKGFIKIAREIESHWIWLNPLHLRAWIYLLLEASWEPKIVPWGNGQITLQRGQLVTTTRRLMGQWGFYAGATLNLLRVFENEGMIDVKKDTKMTLITIKNYEKYQLSMTVADGTVERKSERKSEHILINKENNITTTTSTTTREQKLKFLKLLETDDSFWEDTCMGIHGEVSDELIKLLKKRFKKFYGEYSSKTMPANTPEKIRGHLFNWLRRSVEIEAERKTRARENSSNNYQNQSNQSDTNGRITKDKYDPRRSSPVSDATADDGDGAF